MGIRLEGSWGNLEGHARIVVIFCYSGVVVLLFLYVTTFFGVRGRVFFLGHEESRRRGMRAFFTALSSKIISILPPSPPSFRFIVMNSRRLSQLVHCRRFATANAGLHNDTGQNLTEKIVQRYAVGLASDKIVKSGEYISIKPEHCMSHDNCTSPSSRSFLF